MGYTLPGFFRPTKQWDVVVYADEEPIVVVELKSQTGPSFGNNANNRAEEAIGSAVDYHAARSAGLIPGNAWTGYVFVIENVEASVRRRGDQDRGLYPKDDVFTAWSYVDRVRVLADRLVVGGYYNAAWAVATTRPPHFSWREIDAATSGWAGFAEGMVAAIGRHYPVQGEGVAQIALFE
jgi:hypothetical protein